LHIAPAVLEQLATTFEVGPEFLPYKNLLHGLLSFAWDNFFLEAYRCLEQLYAEPRVSALTSAWASSLSLKEVAALLEQHLSWRPKEDEALAGLISSCENSTLSRICGAFDVPFPGDPQSKPGDVAARRIYDLRNNIVHYRPIHASISKLDDEWNDILGAMLEAVGFVYSRVGQSFFRASSPAQG